MDDQTLMDLFGSLSREIGALRQDVTDGFERTRVGRQGGSINGGGRQVARLIEWSEKMDQMLVEEWARRLDKLEGKKE
jgi:hypothetical protein